MKAAKNAYFLCLKIELAKERLKDIARQYGRQHPRTLAYSRKLDQMIVEFQRMKMTG